MQDKKKKKKRKKEISGTFQYLGFKVYFPQILYLLCAVMKKTTSI